MSRIAKTANSLQVPDNPTIPFITGDGVGAEITPVTQQVVNVAVERAYGTTRRIDWTEVLAGEKAFQQTGTWLPAETLEAFDSALVGIKGPLTTPVGGGIRSLNVALRQQLDLYACVRPVRWFRGVASPLKRPELVDMVIFRENTEDIYAGIEWPAGSPEAARFGAFLQDELGVTKVRFPKTSAYGVKPVSEEGSKRLVRAACEYARAHRLERVTLVHKGNIMKFTEGGFKQWGYEIASEYPDLQVNDVITDAFLQNTLLHPADFQVIATLNLNGDYISDQLAAMVGGIGIAPGANINYSSGHAIFEATHGTAPDIAGQNIANPCSLILSATLMLEYLGWDEPAALIVRGLEQCFARGVAPIDLARFMKDGKPTSTTQFGEEIIAAL